MGPDAKQSFTPPAFCALGHTPGGLKWCKIAGGTSTGTRAEARAGILAGAGAGAGVMPGTGAKLGAGALARLCMPSQLGRGDDRMAHTSLQA